MLAMTIKPPWSWVITHSTKRIENRTWSRSYRGLLAIHAGKGWDLDGEFSPLVQQAWRETGNGGDLVVDFPGARGAVVAVVELVDICSARGGYTDCDCGPWAAAFQYHWRLANVRALAEPVPCRGFQQLWTLPDEVEASVVAQLGERTDA